MNKIAVIGSGNWGSALYNLLKENNPSKEIVMWGDNLEENLEPYIKNADLMTMVVPSQYVRETCKKIKPYFNKDRTTILTASKGMEINGCKMMRDVIFEELGTNQIAALSGPNLASEVRDKKFTGAVIASEIVELYPLKQLFENEYFKVETTDDIIGVEIGGALKNIIAIAVGITTAQNGGDNNIGYLVTKGLDEITQMGLIFGAKKETFRGLSGLGDLVTTGISHKSRNHMTGEKLAEGWSLQRISDELLQGQVAEGVDTCRAVYEYVEAHKLDLPITKMVYDAIKKSEK